MTKLGGSLHGPPSVLAAALFRLAQGLGGGHNLIAVNHGYVGRETFFEFRLENKQIVQIVKSCVAILIHTSSKALFSEYSHTSHFTPDKMCEEHHTLCNTWYLHQKFWNQINYQGLQLLRFNYYMVWTSITYKWFKSSKATANSQSYLYRFVVRYSDFFFYAMQGILGK